MPRCGGANGDNSGVVINAGHRTEGWRGCLLWNNDGVEGGGHATVGYCQWRRRWP